MIEVVGVPAAGVSALPPDLLALVNDAAVVVSSPRLLATLPDTVTANRVTWPRPLLPGLDDLLKPLLIGPQPVVALATGDPLDHGIGTTLIRRLGARVVRVHPVAGSVALARARMGWSAQEVDVVSLVNSPASTVRRVLTPGRRILVLSAGSHSPAEVAEQLITAGWPTAQLSVLGLLGARFESRRNLTAAEAITHTAFHSLNVIAIELGNGPTIGTSPGRPDTEYEHDGQLSKQEVRSMALASLRPAPGQLLWDLGAGAGSVAIEWALHDPRCRAIAVERDPDRVARIQRNADTAGVGTAVRVVASPVLEALPDLPVPDAIFLGGGISAEVIDHAWDALPPGGRLVAHTVTLDTEEVVVAAMRRHGGSLRRVSIERAETLGRYLAWRPARPVVEWSATKIEQEVAP